MMYNVRLHSHFRTLGNFIMMFQCSKMSRWTYKLPKILLLKKRQKLVQHDLYLFTPLTLLRVRFVKISRLLSNVKTLKLVQQNLKVLKLHGNDSFREIDEYDFSQIKPLIRLFTDPLFSLQIVHGGTYPIRPYKLRECSHTGMAEVGQYFYWNPSDLDKLYVVFCLFLRPPGLKWCSQSCMVKGGPSVI